MQINLHDVKRIVMVKTQVRGEKNCPDHNLAEIVIQTEHGEVQLNLFSGGNYNFYIEEKYDEQTKRSIPMRGM